MRLTRRKVLIGAAAGGGLIAAFALAPRDYPIPLPAGEGEHAFNAWIKVGRDGVVTVAVPQLEMGQGVTTWLPRIAAQEMGADWRQVAVEPAAVSAAYADPVLAAHWSGLWAQGLRGVGLSGLADSPDDWWVESKAVRDRMMITAEGTGIAAFERPVREAAASVRAVLAMAAAQRWDVSFEECEAEAGFIVHGDKRLRFAELVDDAAGLGAPQPPPLRPDPPSDAGAAIFAEGEKFARLDAPSKVDGSFPFAADIRLPGMVFAAIAHGPLADSRLDIFDEEAARSIPGYLGRVESEGWLAAVASSNWAARKAIQAMKPRFVPYEAVAESVTIAQRLSEAIDLGAGEPVFQRGEIGEALGGMGVTNARYALAPTLHGTLETGSAVARLKHGRLELWLATQAPEQARTAAAEAIGLPTEDVVLYPMAAGGSFDSRLDTRIAREVSALAKALARPVSLTYSRWQETLTGMPRPAALAELSAVSGSDGRVRALRCRVAAQPAAREMEKRLFDGMSPHEAMAEAAGQYDPLSQFGGLPAYDIPNLSIEGVAVDTDLPAGRLRGNGDARACFLFESFIDELAGVAGSEPLSYRIAMLGNNPRMFECLQGAAQLAGWDGGSEGSAQGLACWQMMDPAGREDGGGRIAVIANARPGERGVEVSRIAAFCDIGRIIDHDLALQQVEGGLLYGMAQAIGSAVTYRRGLPDQRKLGDFGLPRLSDVPEVSVAFADNTAPPFDPGEIGVVAVAPAIANALRSATQRRWRNLPLRSEESQ